MGSDKAFDMRCCAHFHLNEGPSRALERDAAPLPRRRVASPAVIPAFLKPRCPLSASRPAGVSRIDDGYALFRVRREQELVTGRDRAAPSVVPVSPAGVLPQMVHLYLNLKNGNTVRMREHRDQSPRHALPAQYRVRFHGHACSGLAAGYRVAIAAMQALGVARPYD